MKIIGKTLKREENKIPLEKGKKKISLSKIMLFVILIIFVFSLLFIILKNLLTLSIIFTLFIFLLIFYIIIKKKLTSIQRIKKMEEAFPDFIEMMASNLRAGMTIDQSLLLSSRKEFYPLDEEILIVGKEIVTGRDITLSLSNLAKRINSQKINKTISIITTGIKSGGNLAVLLEETATNMREREFIEKKAASNVLMYLIFIFFAAGVGAPILFSLSSVLVKVLTNLLGNIPVVESNINLPFSIKSINISSSFVMYFSMTFLICIDILASLLLGLINKGEEKEGIKYIIPLVATSLFIYFVTQYILSIYLPAIIG